MPRPISLPWSWKESSWCFQHGMTYLIPFWGSPPMLISRDFAKSSPRSSSFYLTMCRRESTICRASSWMRRITSGSIAPISPLPPSSPSTTLWSQTIPLMWLEPRSKPFTRQKSRITNSSPPPNAKTTTLFLQPWMTHGSANCVSLSRSTRPWRHQRSWTTCKNMWRPPFHWCVVTAK